MSTNAMPLEDSILRCTEPWSCTPERISDYSQLSCDSYLRQDITTKRELPTEEFARAIFGRADRTDSVESPKVQNIARDARLNTDTHDCVTAPGYSSHSASGSQSSSTRRTEDLSNKRLRSEEWSESNGTSKRRRSASGVETALRSARYALERVVNIDGDLRADAPGFYINKRGLFLRNFYDEATGEPRIYHCEDVDPGSSSPGGKLSSVSNSTNDVCEPRVVRVVVSRELRPIHELTSAEELAKVFRDIFECYRRVYEEAKILHRDIRPYNMMYYRTADGKVHGVLNDFDLDASESEESKRRTSTAAFMAYELLLDRPIRHLYRHDFESFFYVILILTSHFKNGKEIEQPPLRYWFSLDSRSLVREKTVLLAKIRGFELPMTTDEYTAFTKWLHPMQDMFSESLVDDKMIDEETLGGQVTFDRMSSIFSIDLASDDTTS